jgi:hypothetical protein
MRSDRFAYFDELGAGKTTLKLIKVIRVNKLEAIPA